MSDERAQPILIDLEPDPIVRTMKVVPTLEPGQALIVSVPERPESGYRWRLAEAPEGLELIRTRRPRTTRDIRSCVRHHPNPRAYFTLRALRDTATGTICLRSERPWLGSQEPDREVTVSLIA